MPRRTYKDLGYSVRRRRVLLFDRDWEILENEAARRGIDLDALIGLTLQRHCMDTAVESVDGAPDWRLSASRADLTGSQR